MSPDEENQYDVSDLWKEDRMPGGAYTISLRPISRRELRIDYWTGAFLAVAPACRLRVTGSVWLPGQVRLIAIGNQL